MRPRVGSYGASSTLTRSPGRIRMKWIRILPEMWARTLWPDASSTRNMALGSTSTTVPSTSMTSFLAIRYSPAASIPRKASRTSSSLSACPEPIRHARHGRPEPEVLEVLALGIRHTAPPPVRDQHRLPSRRPHDEVDGPGVAARPGGRDAAHHLFGSRGERLIIIPGHPREV